MYNLLIRDYTDKLSGESDNAELYHARGLAYRASGDHEKARDDFKRASVLDPKNYGHLTTANEE